MERRSKQLVLPRLQLSLIVAFLGTSLFCLVFQYLLLAVKVAALARELPHDGPELLAGFHRALPWIALASLGFLFPATLIVGIHVTHRVAGPLHRLLIFLERVRSGDRPADLEFRKSDLVPELGQAVNEATRPLRESAPDAARARSNAA